MSTIFSKNLHCYCVAYLLVSCCALVIFVKADNLRTTRSKFANDKTASSQLENVSASSINTTLCSDRGCSKYCHSYVTPMSVCYNGKKMFSSDVLNPFGPQDAKDVMNSDGKSFHRYFYASTDGTCTGESTDGFAKLPIGSGNCVGPFGFPSPYGWFEVKTAAEIE